MARRKNSHDQALDALFNLGLGFPGAHVKSPWPGHRDLAVKDKTFAYLNVPGDPLSISCKLPHSCDEALRLPFTTPTEYGLGKSGWVSARFDAGAAIPLDMLEAWLVESYHAQAPKRLSAELTARGSSVGHATSAGSVVLEPTRKPAKKKVRSSKRAAKKQARQKATTPKASAARKPAGRRTG